jgi:hypothetical protein
MSYLEKIKEKIKEIKVKEDALSAKELLVLLNEKLKDRKYEDDWEALGLFKKDLYIYNFRFFDENKLLRYLSDGFEDVLKTEDISYIVDSVKFFLITYWHIDKYMVIRERLLQNLYENKHKLTKGKIVYNNGRELKPTVQNWFKHYQGQFDHKKDFRVGMMGYLNNSKAIKALSDKEKEAVKNLIYLLEYLRSDAEETLVKEEDYVVSLGNNKYLQMHNGELKEVEIEQEDIDFSEGIAEIWAEVQGGSEGDEKAKTDIKKDISKIVSPKSSNINKIIKQKIQLSEEELINFRHMIEKYRALEDSEIMNYFWEGLDSYNKYMLMGAMQELVHRKQWKEIWEISRLRLLLNDYRSRKLKQLAIDSKNVKENLKVLLTFLLENHLSLPIANARKWELYLVNLLVKNGYSEYKDLIYFDSESQKLKWEEK